MKVTIQKKEITLREPFVYYLDTLLKLPYAEVRIETDEHVIGIGEIPCALDINGETAEGSVQLASLIEGCLFTISIQSEEDIVSVMEVLSLRLAFNEALKFGVEQALFDILVKTKKKTLAEIFISKKKELQMQVTLPYLESIEEYNEKFSIIFEKNLSHLKIKVGSNIKQEAEVIKLAREYSSSVFISVDANQAFETFEDANSLLKKIEQYDIAWIEQPLVKSASIEEWLTLKSETSILLMADESVHTQKDVQFFLQNKAVDYINVKLSKCGGIVEARKIIKTAKKFKIPVMLGSMLEGERALKYNLAFGLSEDFIVYDFSRNYRLKDENTQIFIDEKTLCTTKEVLS